MNGLFAGQAFAEPAAQLEYHREVKLDACPDEAALRRAVRERLGYDPFFHDAEQTIIASIVKDAGGLRGEVQLLDAAGSVRGSRQLRAETAQCTELVSRMALAISIAVDPFSLGSPPRKPSEQEPPRSTPAGADASVRPESSEPPRQPPSAQTPPLLPERAVQDAVKREAGLVVELAIGVLASTGLSPELALGPVVDVGLRRGPFSVALEVRYQVAQDLVSGMALVESSLAESSLIGCMRHGFAMLCGDLTVSRLAIEGTQIDRPKADSTWVPRLGPRIGAELPIVGMLGARAQVGALVALNRPSVALSSETVWRSPALGGFIALSMVGRFP